tara:strand:+ start:604 stop:1143 length:540 start_codon:yes stop_codon:yes gene_type:complete
VTFQNFDNTIKEKTQKWSLANLKNPRRKKGKAVFKYKKLWSFPQRTEEFLKTKLYGNILHVCAGASNIGAVRLDIEKQAEQNKDGFILGDMYNLPIKNNTFDCAFIDPAWNIPYHQRMKFCYEIRDKIKMDGLLILNAPFIPKIKCCVLKEVYYGERSFYQANVSLISIYQKVQSQFIF